MSENEQEHSSHKHDSVRFYSHSQLFYFWPVWLVSFIFAGITAYSGKTFTLRAAERPIDVTMVEWPGMGLAFLLVLICIILFTCVNFRGVWAALVAAFIVIIALLFNILQLWGPILRAIGNINFFINMHFYLWMGIVLFTIWFLIVAIYDRRHYIELRPTQISIVEEVGDGERNFDTVGLVFDKRRDNFFQHWLLGFGSGDLIVITSGGQREQIRFPNVMRIGKRIDQLTKIREQRGH